MYVSIVCYTDVETIGTSACFVRTLIIFEWLYVFLLISFLYYCDIVVFILTCMIFLFPPCFIAQSVEFFLSKDITHFITNKQQTTLVSRTSSQDHSSTFSPNHVQYPQTPVSSASLDINTVSSPLPAVETRVSLSDVPIYFY